MKTFKALRKPSTGKYWHWNDIEGWALFDSPDLLKQETTLEDLAGIGMIPDEAGEDVELTEIVVMEKSEYNKIKPDFLENHPLELLFLDEEEVKIVQGILKEANTHYVLEVKEGRERPSGCNINIVCPKTTFANAYYHVGAQIGKLILAKRE